MSTDYKVLHEEFCKSRTEIATLKEKNNALQDVQKEMKTEQQKYIPLAVHNASVNECKKYAQNITIILVIRLLTFLQVVRRTETTIRK